jgi:hypothetical protein
MVKTQNNQCRTVAILNKKKYPQNAGKKSSG